MTLEVARIIIFLLVIFTLVFAFYALLVICKYERKIALLDGNEQEKGNNEENNDEANSDILQESSDDNDRTL